MKRLLSQVFAILFAILLTLSLFEIALRIRPPGWLVYRMAKLHPSSDVTGFGSDVNWKVDRKNGKFWRFTPGSSFDVVNYEFNAKAHIDAFGGRRTVCDTCEIAETLPPVVFFGDSFTFGIGIEDDETIPSRLANLASPHRVLNLAIPGSSLKRHLDILEMRHEELGGPQKYIFALSLNQEFADLIKDKEETISGPAGQLPSSPEGLIWTVNNFVYHNAILKRVYLLQFVRHFALRAIARKDPEGLVSAIFPVIDMTNTAYHKLSQSVFDEQIERLENLKRKYNFDAAIVALPNVSQIDPAVLEHQVSEYGYRLEMLDVSMPNKIFAKGLANRSIRLIDPTDCIRQHSVGKNLYFMQDQHFTALGTRVVADCLRHDLGEYLKN